MRPAPPARKRRLPGSQTHADDLGNGVSGRYDDRLREARADAQAYDPEARRRLWRLSERLAGLPED
jgi:hypothetical protein